MRYKKVFRITGTQTAVHRGLRSFFCALAALAAAAGCASNEEIGRIQYDLISLKSEVKEIRGPAGEQSQFADRVEQIEQGQETDRKTVSDLFMKVQSLTNEFQVLTGHFEEARYTAEKSSQDMARDREKIMAKLSELEFTIGELEKKLAAQAAMKPPALPQKPSPDTGTPESQKTETPEQIAAAPADSVKETYMNAYRMFKSGNYSGAREIFTALLKDHADSEYSDNARFWIGETYYKEQNYEESILAYEELLKHHPDSEKVPGAMLKQGMAFFGLQDQETGIIIFEKLIEKYPESEQARVAQKKLKPPTPGKNIE